MTTESLGKPWRGKQGVGIYIKKVWWGEGHLKVKIQQRIFPTQGLNPGLLHFKRILYHLSHQESPEMANRSSIIAWKIARTEEPGRLHTVHRVAKSQAGLSH